MSGERWYGGLAHSSERPLTDAEAAAVRARIRKVTVTARIALVVGLASIFSLVALLNRPAFSRTHLVLLIAWLGASGWSESRFEWLKKLQRDLSAGVVHVADGTFTDVGDPKLLAAQDGTEPNILIAVLPQSRLVVGCNGQPLRQRVIVSVGETSPVPPRAALASQYVRDSGDDVVLTHQRAFSDEEVRELDRRMPRLTGTTVLTLLVVAAFAASLLLFDDFGTRRDIVMYGALPMFLIVRTAWSRWRLWRRFQADGAMRYVIIVRTREGDELSTPSGSSPIPRFSGR